MNIEIIKPSTTKYFINCNPLEEVYHVGEVPPNTEMHSGQPISVVADVENEVIDLIFSEYVQQTEDSDATYVVIPTDWSVGYDLATATAMEDSINTLSFLSINAIKHPDREEYAIPYQEAIFAAIPEGELKDQLAAASAASVAAGNRKTSMEMHDDGWCTIHP